MFSALKTFGRQGINLQGLNISNRYARMFSTVRVNVCTGEWIAFPGAAREKRPQHFVPPPTTVISPPIYVNEKCPFCLGNEYSLPDLLLTLYASDFAERSRESHFLSVVPNRFPLVSPTVTIEEGSYPQVHGVTLGNDSIVFPSGMSNNDPCFTTHGFHEVVIDHQYHYLPIKQMTSTYWELLFRAFRDRYLALQHLSPDIKSILLFKNTGLMGGASIIHPHSQILALPFIPHKQIELLNTAQAYERNLGACVYCDYMKNEIAVGERIVEQTEEYVALVPYAARLPYLIQIFPLEHHPQFAQMNDFMLRKLAKLVRRVFIRLSMVLGGSFDFNVTVVNSIPHQGEGIFHWHLELIPRLDSYPIAGFELTTGILCNATMPEDNAHALRAVDLLQSNVDVMDFDDSHVHKDKMESRCEHSMNLRHIHP